MYSAIATPLGSEQAKGSPASPRDAWRLLPTWGEATGWRPLRSKDRRPGPDGRTSLHLADQPLYSKTCQSPRIRPAGWLARLRTRNHSPGRPAEQLLDTSALALGRTARAAVAGSHHHSLLARRRGRAVVDIAPGGNRGADTLGDDLLDDHDALASLVVQPHFITGPYGMGGLDPHPVDPDVPGPAGTGRGRTGPGQPHRPDPAVHPPSLLTCHPAHCNAIRARWLRPAWRLPRRAPAVSGMTGLWPTPADVSHELRGAEPRGSARR